MRILIADDDAELRFVLATALADWGHEVLPCAEGASAWQQLQEQDAPALAILDWNMPRMDGLEVCRRYRALPHSEPMYLILLTGRKHCDDVVAGLEGGADEYMVKPIELTELHARIDVGLRIVRLQRTLAQRVRELEEAASRIHQLHGLLPICSWCKKIRNDRNYWEQVEEYMAAHLGAQFTHGICPDCSTRVLAQLEHS